MLLDFLQLNIPKGGNMRKADKTKLLLVMGISLIFSIAGCVDTSVQPIPSNIVYHSQLSIVNLVAGGGAATLKMVDYTGATSFTGNINFGDASSFKTVQAGAKSLFIKFGSSPEDTLKFSLTSDYKFRVFLAGSDSSYNVYRNAERYIDATSLPSDTSQIEFFNGSPDVTLNSVTITGGGESSTVTFTNALALGNVAPYMKLKAGSYSFDVSYDTPDTTLTATFNKDLASKGRYTAVIYDSANNLKTKVFTDD
jgi:hypothetical protein